MGRNDIAEMTLSTTDSRILTKHQTSQLDALAMKEAMRSRVKMFLTGEYEETDSMGNVVMTSILDKMVERAVANDMANPEISVDTLLKYQKLLGESKQSVEVTSNIPKVDQELADMAIGDITDDGG